MSSEFQYLRFDVRDGVARLQINRPASLNSINKQSTSELRAVAGRCADDPSIRVVLMSGAGPGFSSGGDMKAFHAQGEALPEYVQEMATEFHVAMSRFARMDALVIAAVHGAIAGGGMSMALSADLVIAAQSAWFTMAYTAQGLTPDGSSTYFLPRLVGFRRAMELMTTNRVLTAAEAMEWGIVNEVVPDSELTDRAEALAAQLAAGPALAFAGVKKLLHAGWTETLESQMERETRTITGIAHSHDAHEGIDAFVSKRPAKFSGS
jgi:2-(1,2-epoxy-1,2-dihydrophenyl)acetyl-CoA isomerase